LLTQVTLAETGEKVRTIIKLITAVLKRIKPPEKKGTRDY
jgi:hypothetical protein